MLRKTIAYQRFLFAMRDNEEQSSFLFLFFFITLNTLLPVLGLGRIAAVVLSVGYVFFAGTFIILKPVSFSLFPVSRKFEIANAYLFGILTCFFIGLVLLLVIFIVFLIFGMLSTPSEPSMEIVQEAGNESVPLTLKEVYQFIVNITSMLFVYMGGMSIFLINRKKRNLATLLKVVGLAIFSCVLWYYLPKDQLGSVVISIALMLVISIGGPLAVKHYD